MAAIVSLYIAPSLDGYIARSDGSFDWCFTDQDYGYTSYYNSVSILLMGRKTFDTAMSFEEYPYPDKPAYVFTRDARRKSSLKDVTFVKKDLIGFVEKLKKTEKGKIWLIGGGEIVHALMIANLIDEMILSIHPILLGDGIALFPKGVRESRWRLIGQRSYNSGLLQLTYEPGRQGNLHMAANSRFAVATHIMTAIAHLERDAFCKDGLVNSEYVASSVNTNPVVIRRILSDLSRAGLVICRQGKGGGVRLGRPIEKINLLDIYEAVGDGLVFAFNPNRPNPKCPVSVKMVDVLTPIFSYVQDGIRQRLKKVKLSDVVQSVG